jgi:hypothetical protein
MISQPLKTPPKDYLCSSCAEIARLVRERDAARAHFRRACEELEKQVRQPARIWPKKPADVWQVEIESERLET